MPLDVVRCIRLLPVTLTRRIPIARVLLPFQSTLHSNSDLNITLKFLAHIFLGSRDIRSSVKRHGGPFSSIPFVSPLFQFPEDLNNFTYVVLVRNRFRPVFARPRTNPGQLRVQTLRWMPPSKLTDSGPFFVELQTVVIRRI